jgi:hypothetical protein
MPGQAAPCRQLTAPLAQVGEAQDGIDQIVVGGELEGVDARAAERRAQFGLAPLCRRREAPAKAAITSKPMSGNSISSGSYRRTATTSWRWARRASGSVHPGMLMKSETMKMSERRGATR